MSQWQIDGLSYICFLFCSFYNRSEDKYHIEKKRRRKRDKKKRTYGYTVALQNIIQFRK